MKTEDVNEARKEIDRVYEIFKSNIPWEEVTDES
jgi:hypothetical protein